MADGVVRPRPDVERLKFELDEAAALRHPRRAMRVTLECGHLRLIEQIHTVMGIGARTACIMPPCGTGAQDGPAADRLVVNVEETGVLLTWGERSHG